MPRPSRIISGRPSTKNWSNPTLKPPQTAVNGSDVSTTDDEDDDVRRDSSETSNRSECESIEEGDSNNSEHIATNETADFSDAEEPSLEENSSVISPQVILLFCVPLLALFVQWGWPLISYNITDEPPVSKASKCNLTSYGSVNEELWLHLNIGISEVERFDKPSVFLYVYNQTDEYIDELVRNLSWHASCNLNHHWENPIELTNNELKSSKVLNDYGYIIDKYRNELEEKKVMVIKHLERVPGVSAQAFHTFCDEYSPLVARSLFMFTVHVDNLPEDVHDISFVEDTLRDRWPELDEDIFAPLFTRISSSILRVI